MPEQVYWLSGNILEVDHKRASYGLAVRITEFDLVIQLRSPDNAERVLAGLIEYGFSVRRLRNMARKDTVRSSRRESASIESL